jgi:hypothetical protein
MAHWEHRDEPRWRHFKFNQPYGKGLARLKDEVLAKTDFDPATLWQWGTMQAMALVGVLEAAERAFGADGQRVVGDAIDAVGYDVGRQITVWAATGRSSSIRRSRPARRPVISRCGPRATARPARGTSTASCSKSRR